MPVSILIQTRNRAAPEYSSSNSICSGSWTTRSKPCRAASNKCSAANTPSSNTMGWVNSRRPQCQPLLQPRDRECIRLCERQCCWNEAVPIGVGLDDRHDSRAAARSRIVRRLCRKARVSMTARIAGSPEDTVAVGIGNIVREARELALEGQLRRCRFSPLRCFDEVDFGDAFFGGLAVVDFFAIDQEDHVCVLFDRTRFPKI